MLYIGKVVEAQKNGDMFIGHVISMTLVDGRYYIQVMNKDGIVEKFHESDLTPQTR